MSIDLGPAEQHIVDEMRELVQTAIKATSQLQDALEKIDLDALEVAIQDPERRKSLISTLQPMQSLASGLHMQILVPALVGILLKERTPE